MFLLLVIALAVAQAAQPVPVFTAEGVRPYQRGDSKLLAGGMVVELYGRDLAPQPWCGEPAMPKAPYPTAVCGVRVLVGNSPSELLFVSPGQINFRVPMSAPSEGSAPLQVCVGPACSAALTMPFSRRNALLKLDGPAYARMPVWIDIDAPAPRGIAYPCDGWPWSFPGYAFEVRREGQTVAPAPVPVRKGGMDSGCGAPAPRGRLPLHLLYSFDQPGTYSVQFTARRGSETLYQSDWTEIVIEPYNEQKRSEWLGTLGEKAARADAGEIAREIVPSLLAWPDEKALAILLAMLEADPPECRNAGCVRRTYETAALAAFDDDLLRHAVPRETLLRLCPPKGICR